jgi:hypothetical protein
MTRRTGTFVAAEADAPCHVPITNHRLAEVKSREPETNFISRLHLGNPIANITQTTLSQDGIGDFRRAQLAMIGWGRSVASSR